jgi:hypothetical protein
VRLPAASPLSFGRAVMSRLQRSAWRLVCTHLFEAVIETRLRHQNGAVKVRSGAEG